MKIPDYNKKIKHPTYLKMQEEIKRLKEEYVMLQNASDEVEEEKDKEIERLKEQLNDEIDDELKQSEIMVKQQNEIERQKEIIRQLDIKNLELTTIIRQIEDIYTSLQFSAPENMYIFINELGEILKGSDKE